MRITGENRRFLLLQGPHGPFFRQLSAMLVKSGAQVWRAGFNRGDSAFWPDTASYIAFKGTAQDWPATVSALIEQKQITDIVLYGDTRPLHAHGVRIAK